MPNTPKISESNPLRIDLSHHPDKFSSESQNLTITKKVNYIFGKNGTGKTTISNEIMAQLSTNYDVCVFKDFEGVADNNRLNAVALGKENSKIQIEIDAVDVEIAEIKKQIDPPEDTITENFFSKARQTKRELNSQKSDIDKFFTDSARTIKNISNPQLAKTSYDKISFKKDISFAKLQTIDVIEEHKKTIKADKKNDIDKVNFPNIDLNSIFKSTNEILLSEVTQSQVITELVGNIDKQNFARQGMRIHEHMTGEKCSFCGNVITQERWELLGNYFNDEVKALENRIKAEISKISSTLNIVKEINDISESLFYDLLKPEVKTVNLKLAAKRNEYKEFLTNLQTALEGKKKNIFSKSTPITLSIPDNIDDIKIEIQGVISRHNELSLNLHTKQENAKNALRFHEVAKLLDEYNYNDKLLKLETLKECNNVAQKALEEMQIELSKKQAERNLLILQTKDEEKIAEKINKLLKRMGVVSFSLKLVDDNVENQKGQYQIMSYDKSIRPIMNLSKGEKNIIAFLYFLYSLESVDGKNKPKIIVLDDPMTSNDDTMQYLMIGEIQKYYRKLNDGNCFILLTHNCHFYLNVRPNTGKRYTENGTEISFYQKYGVLHLHSDGWRTTINTITDGKQDFATSYETLWKELIFLHNAENASPDLMLSPSRKICETYMKFTRKSVETFYGDNLSAKKLFDVNQHSMDDFEAEVNGKTKSEIKTILQTLFKENGAEEHFKSYWTGDN